MIVEPGNDTIVAVATPPAPAPRAVIRLSGPATLDVVTHWLDQPLPEQQRAFRREVVWRSPPPIGPVPLAIYVWPSRRSYTGEPAAELHVVGSPPIVQVLLEGCLAAGARLAKPGEFTLRAFLAGRIDLTQAEAVLGVIDADDDRRLQAALRQLAGGIGHPLEKLRQRLVESLAQLEAGLDFVDEDIEFISADQLRSDCREVAEETDRLLRQLESQDRAGTARRVVLVGLPNAGKSSLLNALAGREAALTSAEAGTTRDPVTVRVNWQGESIELIDTAGDDPAASDPIAFAAQELRRQSAEGADLSLFCIAPDQPRRLEIDEMLLPSPSVPSARVVAVLTKADLCSEAGSCPELGQKEGVCVSSKTGKGLDELRDRICCELARLAGDGEVAIGVRCRDGLVRARRSLAEVERLLDEGAGEELVALELREGLAAIGELVGAFYTDELLDAIFGRFCIGK